MTDVMNKINYVELELLGNRATDKVKKGLLAGFSVENDTTLVNIIEKNSSSLYVSLNSYSIVKIKTATTSSIAYTFGKDTPKDKILCTEVIKDILVRLRAVGMVDKDGHIDVKMYKNVPDEYKLKKVTNVFGLNSATKTVKSTAKIIKPAPKPVTTATTATNVYVKPQKKITYIRRKTKKPSIEDLKLLRKKVEDIVNGVYQAKKLPEIIKISVPIEYVDEILEGWNDVDDPWYQNRQTFH